MTFLTKLNRLKAAATDGATHDKFVALNKFLANHADALAELVRWVPVLVGQAEGDDLEAEVKVLEAIATLDAEDKT